MEVRLRIKKIRKEKQISQTELARKVKTLNQSQICKIENGDRILKAEELISIAKALNVSVVEIMD